MATRDLVRPARPHPRAERGLEFALVLPILLILLLGILDFGRAIYAFNSV